MGTGTGMRGVSVLAGSVSWIGSIHSSVHPELGYIPDETALGQRGFGLLVAVMNACHVMWMDDSGLGVMTWR
jgi:hypothetical protein